MDERRIMIWQDIVMMSATFGFSAALIPALWGKKKPPRLQCLIWVILLLVVIVCLTTLNLWLAAMAQGIQAMLWSILFFQYREN